MSMVWQDVAVLVIVGVCGAHLLRRFQQSFFAERSRAACGGGCAGCSAGAKRTDESLVALTIPNQFDRLRP